MEKIPTLKLYKFRSLGDDTFTWTKRIIETGEFWCSPIWEQNDSMEGVYSYWQSHENPNGSIDIYPEKNSYRICSFSGKGALKDPKMWGYYANGFKGLAVEIEISSDEIKKVDYQNSLLCEDTDSPDIEKIITTKLKYWRSENEYRFLKKRESGYCKIGKITGVYFGNPYRCVENKDRIVRSSPKIQKYFEIRNELIRASISNKYPCFDVSFSKPHDEWRITWEPIEKVSSKSKLRNLKNEI